MRKEIYNLQIVRGIAALCVVFGHLSPDSLSQKLNTGQIGVSMFFFLSGYIMMHTFREEQSASVFLWGRIKRIYPTYLILSFPLFIFTFFKTGSLTYLLHSLFLFPWLSWNREALPWSWSSSLANPASWTLVYEFYFYGLLALGKLLLNRKKFVYPFVSVLMLAVLAGANLTWGNNGHLGWYGVTFKAIATNLAVLSFIVGMSSSQIDIKRLAARPIIFLFIPLSVALLFIMEKQGPANLQWRDFLGSCLPCWMLVFMLAKMENLKGIIFNWLHTTGMYSYSLYLFHANFYIAKVVIFNKIAHSNYDKGSYKIAILLAFISASLWCSKYLYRYVEKGEIFQLFRSPLTK